MNAEKLFYCIGGIDEEFIELAQRKGTVHTMSKKIKILIPIAACLAVMIAVAGVLGNNFHRGYTVQLPGGEEYVFRKASVSSASADMPMPPYGRELTDNEMTRLLPKAVGKKTGYCWFDDNTGAPVRFEGEIGAVKIIAAKKGTVLNDVVIDEAPSQAVIDGTKVMLGYFLTDKNSRGQQNAVFCGTFECGAYNIYAEAAGDSGAADDTARSLAEMISMIIENGLEAFARIRMGA